MRRLEVSLELALARGIHLRAQAEASLRHKLVGVHAALELALRHLVEILLLVHHAIVHWGTSLVLAWRHSHTHVWVETLVLHLWWIAVTILIVLTFLASKLSIKVIGIEILSSEIVHLFDNLYAICEINYDVFNITRLKQELR